MLILPAYSKGDFTREMTFEPDRDGEAGINSNR